MKYVVDSAVVFKCFIREAGSDEALLLLEDFQNQFHELLAPDILPVEVTHGLTPAERQGRISPDESEALFQILLDQLPPLVPYLSLLPRAHSISSAMRHGVYDCLYVALAEREQCELITSDDKLIKNLGPTFPFIRSLKAMP